MIKDVGLPENPELVSHIENLGYEGNTRYVAWSWHPVFDAPQWIDSNGNWAIVRPKRGPWLETILPSLQSTGVSCGDRHVFGRHILVWDRVAQRCWTLPRQLGLAFIAMAK